MMAARTVLQIERGVHRAQHFLERLEFGHRPSERSCTCLHFVEQPYILDRDHRLVGECGDEFDLAIRERHRVHARQREGADYLTVAE